MHLEKRCGAGNLEISSGDPSTRICCGEEIHSVGKCGLALEEMQ